MKNEHGGTTRQDLRYKANTAKEFIGNQAKQFEKALRDYKLEGIKVQDQTEIRDAGEFTNKLIYGHAHAFGYEAPAVYAGMSGSTETDPPVADLYVAPIRDTSGFLVDDKTKTLYTDSFWVREENTVTHVIPTEPVPIDGIDIWDVPDEQWETSPYTAKWSETDRAIVALTDDKHATKQVLRDAGIPVADGVLIKSEDSDAVGDNLIVDFIKRHPKGTHVVVKPNDGVRGDNVSMGNPLNREEVKRLDATIRLLRAQQKDILLEERIITPALIPLETILQEYYAQKLPDKVPPDVTAKDIEYNFRVLTTQERDPKVIDAEIRYDLFGPDPVNVSKGALVARVEALGMPGLEEAVYTTAKKAVKAIYEHAYHVGDPEGTTGYVGVDVIPDQDGTMHVIEVQSGPAGIGSLTKIDERPLSSLADVYAPTRAQYLAKRLEDRPATPPEDLRRIPGNVGTMINAYRTYNEAGNFIQAERTLNQITSEYPTTDLGLVSDNLGRYAFVAENTGNYRYGMNYIDSLIASDPDNKTLQRFKSWFEDKMTEGQSK